MPPRKRRPAARNAGRPGSEPGSASEFRRGEQALDHLAVLEVGLDDLVDIAGVHVGVPGALGIDDRDGPARAAVQAARLVHAHLAGTSELFGLDARLAVVERLLRAVVGTAVLAVDAVVEAEENVAGVVAAGRGSVFGHVRILGGGGGAYLRRRAAGDLQHHVHQRRVGPEPAEPLAQAVEADETPLLPGQEGFREVGAGRRLVEQVQMPDQHEQQQHPGGAARQGHEQQRRHQARDDAHTRGQAQPLPGVGRAVAERGGQRGHRHPGGDHAAGIGHPAPDVPDRAVAQQAGNEQPEQHREQLRPGHQGLQRGVAHRQPFEEGGVGQRFSQRGFQPLPHLAEPERHGRREQQRGRPERDQHQGAARVLHEPARAEPAPAGDGPQPLQQCGHERPQQGAGRIEQQVHVGRHPPRQVDLQQLHEHGKHAAGQHGHHHGRPGPARSQQRQGQQEAQRRVACDIDVDVEPGPVRRRNPGREEYQWGDALLAPALEGKQAREDDERDVGQRERPGGGLVHGGARPVQNGLTTTSTTAATSRSTGTSLNQRYQRCPWLLRPAANLRSSRPQAWW